MVSEVEIEHLGGNQYRVNGNLSFGTVKTALDISQRLFSKDPSTPLDIDLSGVQSSDSAGLALLIEWVSQAKRNKQELVYRNVPKQMLAIAGICEVDKLLPMAS